MSLLRIYGSLLDAAQHCEWVLINDDNATRHVTTGSGNVAQLPRDATRVQLVIPATQVLLTRAQLPPTSKRHSGAVLAYAIEDDTMGEPDAQHVSWLGNISNDAALHAHPSGNDALAVLDQQGLHHWREALNAAGVREYDVYCETLMLPRAAQQWSLAWNGQEGFVRSGEFEGAATDCGDRNTPPLSLQWMLEAAAKDGTSPTSIAIYLYTADAATQISAPDITQWTQTLGVTLRVAGRWHWRTAARDAGGIPLLQERQRWQALAGVAVRLRPAAWIMAAVIVIHSCALLLDWGSLIHEQRSVRQQMEAQFRSVFPDAVAVADPAVQMRRKLAEAHHNTGQPDSGNFLPMLEQVAAAIKDLPPGSVHLVSYESGRITLELTSVNAASVQRIVTYLMQSGMNVDAPLADATALTVVITVRST